MSLAEYRDIKGLNAKEGTLFGDSVLYEKYNRGYVIWQTYRRYENSITAWNQGGGNSMTTSYYKQDYPDITMEEKRTFLYADRKTKVTNKVIFSIKR